MRPRNGARRLALAGAAGAALVVTSLLAGGAGHADGRFPPSVPSAHCGPGSRPETGVQGRVPAADYASGRATRGYTCNAVVVAHQGDTGGFKVLRYTDRTGRTCAFYDASSLAPVGVPFADIAGEGVTVLDLSRPAHPVKTDELTTPTMRSPHESLLVNPRRGLLAAVMGNAYASAGVLEVYDVGTDCRTPRLLSRTADAVLGHESGWTEDGRTFYASSSGGQTLAAIDLSDPTAPRTIFLQYGVNYHGMRLSPDGRLLYVADIGDDLTGLTLPGDGLRIIDVSQIQERRPNPQVTVLSDLTWPEGSIPQVAQPFRRDGRDYLLEVDEFSTVGLNGTSVDVADATVGAARIIDAEDPRHPRVISHLRLAVQQPAARRAAAGDPGASTAFGGYTAHYCSVPTRQDPRIAACSMIGSGLRVFDLRDLAHPREVAYVNLPTSAGAAAFAQPAWDVRRHEIWFTDQNSGFYVVRLTGEAARLLR